MRRREITRAYSAANGSRASLGLLLPEHDAGPPTAALAGVDLPGPGAVDIVLLRCIAARPVAGATVFRRRNAMALDSRQWVPHRVADHSTCRYCRPNSSVA